MKNHIFDLIPEKFRSSAISLETMGVNDVAWPRTIALSIVNILQRNNIAILGGDVLVKEKEQLKHTYDNWYSNRKTREPWIDFVVRSHDETVKYLRKYNDPENGTYAYTIVCCNETDHKNL